MIVILTFFLAARAMSFGDSLLLTVSLSCLCSVPGGSEWPKLLLVVVMDAIKTYFQLLVDRRLLLIPFNSSVISIAEDTVIASAVGEVGDATLQTSDPLDANIEGSTATITSASSADFATEHYHSPSTHTHIPADILEALNVLLGIDRSTLLCIYGSSLGFQVLFTANAALKSYVIEWALSSLVLCSRITGDSQQDDKSWSELRRLMKATISCAEGSSSNKIE